MNIQRSFCKCVYLYISVSRVSSQVWKFQAENYLYLLFWKTLTTLCPLSWVSAPTSSACKRRIHHGPSRRESDFNVRILPLCYSLNCFLPLFFYICSRFSTFRFGFEVLLLLFTNVVTLSFLTAARCCLIREASPPHLPHRLPELLWLFYIWTLGPCGNNLV